jgi:hypothetical protein
MHPPACWPVTLQAKSGSTYIHYEFDVPQDDRPQRADIVAHHNAVRIVLLPMDTQGSRVVEKHVTGCPVIPYYLQL